MSVVSTTPKFSGQTGSHGSDSKKSYTAVYEVLTNDENDGPQVVLESRDLPRLNARYEFGNDRDTSTLLKSLAPNRVDGNRRLWLVTATWETPGDKQMEGQKEDGTPSPDPTLWHDDVEVTPIKYTRPVEYAWYLGGYNGVAHEVLRIREPGPTINSAFEPFDPPPEKDDDRLLIRIGKWQANYPAGTALYQGTINSAPWRLDKSNYGFIFQFEKWTAKLSLTGSFQIVNKFPVWKINYEIEYRKDTWNPAILDRGLNARAWPGDPDGNGGTISSSDLKKGAPLSRRIVDKKGMPIAEPVLFDGDGEPLAKDKPPVYGNWRVYQEKDFGSLDL